ncbi:hypothetical protein FisN_6Lh221 [Fistulifera solaris]|uniref:Uncharacterized protein n=1 Tax=Fistulifera solaris TaxID=1519565 RepID=A0A1Z5J646_FISSO|nr:hypothetical protein FisN_6Lh221 [Fistulifera solaris]|eukprot:GAX09406.1 hypothetical protein FisN_6Lh221 [Fistulifera solaris]
MSDLNETAQVSEEESGSAAEPLQRKCGPSNPVVSRTVEFQGMTRTHLEDGPPIASSSQTSDISADEEEASVGKDGSSTLKLPKKKKGISAKERSMLRKGKWTPEEEEYTSRIIHYFSTGLLILPEGHTLRSYLAEKLNCDPMRITKKYAGAACLGRRAYQYREHAPPTIGEIQLARTQLDDLEHRFRMRVEEGYSGLPFSSTSAQDDAVPLTTHSNVTQMLDQMNSAMGLQNAFNSLASTTRLSSETHNQNPAPPSWNHSNAASVFQNQPAPSMPQQQSNALELAKLLLAQNQTAANLLPLLAQLLATAGIPATPGAVSYQTNNTNASAALLPIIASLLGAASVAPQSQAGITANQVAAPPLFTQMAQSSQMPVTSISLPQMPNPPSYAHTTSHSTQGIAPTFIDTNSQGKNPNATNPFFSQLKNVYDMHVSSLGQPLAPSSTHGQRTNQPLSIASKLPPVKESVPSLQNPVSSSLPERSSWQESNDENQTDGSILVGFLSSLKESYLKALQSQDEEQAGTGLRVTLGQSASRVPTVTDTSSVSQHGSSTEEVEWNPHRRTDAVEEKRRAGSSSKGPPRKRHKQKQQTRRD